MPGIAFAHIVRRILTLSAYMSRLVDSHYLGVNSKPVYAGIPADKFSAATVEDTKVVVFVGRINDQKNVFRLLRAFKLCTDTIPEARLKVIARGSEVAEEEFTHEIKALGLGEKVLWDRESVVNSSTRNQYHDAQVVAYPTLQEAFGLVVVEAMASGRPVITSNFGGPAEIVSNNREGLLVNPYNEVEIATAIITLLSDIGLCREMGHRARSRFEQNFTIERVACSIESHLKTCALS
jgi:glycosyltransferase involved in cell wall biosynthesis